MQEFFRPDYMPHGHCYLWHPGILWTTVLSDLLIAVAYFSIPIAIYCIIKKRTDWQFRGTFFLFSAFISFCGLSHLVSIFTTWHGTYGALAVIKFATASVSVMSAIALFRNFKNIIAIPSVRDVRDALDTAAEEKLKRARLELQQRSDSIFKNATALLPTGLLVTDSNQVIRVANRAFERMFGYGEGELIGKDLNLLLDENTNDYHHTLVQQHMSQNSREHAMAAGRLVSGKTRNGDTVNVEVKLTVDEIDGERLAFATVIDVASEAMTYNQSQEQTNRIRRAIDATDDGIWEWHVPTDRVWYSPRLLHLIGTPSSETPELQKWLDHIHPDDMEKVKLALDSHFNDKTKFEVIYRGRNAEGEYQWLQSRGDTLFDNKGKPILMSGTLTNIDKTRKLEEDLKQKTHFLDQLLSQSLAGLYIFDLTQNQNTFVNPEYTRITGYTLEDLHQEQSQHGDLTHLFHPDDLDRVINHITAVTSNSHPDGSSIEYRFRHKSGHWIWCFSRDSLYSFDDAGKPCEMLGSFFEITDLKEREQEIKSLANKFMTTFEQAAVGIAHVDFDGKFKRVNNRLCQLLQIPKEKLTNMYFKDITYEEDAIRGMALRDQLIRGEIDNFSMEKRYKRPDGSLFWALLTVAIVRDSEYDGGYFISVVEDIEKRKKMEINLAESNSALERFAYSASHDLQEPLRKICAFAELLEENLKSTMDDSAAYQLSRITDASRRMSHMIDSLLQISRYSKHVMQTKPCQLSSIIQKVKEDLSDQISQQNADISFEETELIVDEVGFQQIFKNLISNSLLYAREEQQPCIHISVETNASSTILTYKDNGIGFDESQAQIIFEPFRRLVNKSLPGSGMGLAICKQIMGAHGGKITAKPGKPGAIFIIEIPN